MSSTMDEQIEFNEAVVRGLLSVAKRDGTKISRMAARTLKQMTSVPLNGLPAELREQHKSAMSHMMLVSLMTNPAVCDCVKLLSEESEAPRSTLDILEDTLILIQRAI